MPVVKSSTSDGAEGGCSFTREQIEKLGPGEYAFVLYPAPKAAREEYLQSHEAWLDLTSREHATWVTSMFPRPVELDSRVLMRIPAWTTVGKANSGGFRDVPLVGRGASTMEKTGCVSWEDLRKGLTSPRWDILIDHDWIRALVQFRLTNWAKLQDHAALPAGVIVELVDNRGVRLGAGVGFPNASQKQVYVLARATPAQWEQVSVVFRTPGDTWVDLGLEDVATDASIPPDPNKYYRLPTVWHSKDMYALKPSSGAPTSRQLWEQHRATLGRDAEISFHLDDVVLVAADGTAVDVPTNSPVTYLNHLLSIREPTDPNKPHLARDPIHSPTIPAEVLYSASAAPAPPAVAHPPTAWDHGTRLIRACDTFYDLRDKRMTGTGGKDYAVGARIAVEQDHPWADFSEGNPHLDNMGYYELHFIDVPHVNDPGTGQQLQHMLLHIGVKVEGLASIPAPATGADLYKLLVAASIRLSPGHPSVVVAGHATKDYCLVPDDPSLRSKHITRIRTFFSTSETGKHTIRLQVTATNDPDLGDRSYFSFEKRTLFYHIRKLQRDIQRAPAGFSGHPVVRTGGTTETKDSDGVLHSRFTLAHELGHVFGLPDDYYEPFDPKQIDSSIVLQYPYLPAYGSYEGWQSSARPYNADQGSLMYNKRGLRLRYLWHHARALSTHGPFQNLVPDRPYVLRHRTFAGSGITFRTRDRTQDVSPWNVVAQARLAQGHADLSLFAVGCDEATVEAMFHPPMPIGFHSPSRTHTTLPPARRFHAILVVRTFYRFKFDDTIQPQAGKSAQAVKWDTMFEFYKAYVDTFQTPRLRFCLEGGARFNPRGSVDRVFIAVHPHFAYGSPAWLKSDETDLALNISQNVGSNALIDNDPGTTLDLSLADVCPPWPLLRLALGRPSWKLVGSRRVPNNDPISTSTFEHIAHAVETMLGEPPNTRLVQPC